MNTKELFEKDSRYLLQSTPPRTRLHIVRGRGARVWDADGREYLDFFSGIAVNNVGHCHPRVVEAVKRQAETLMHTTMLYYTEPPVRLAEKLAEITPSSISRFFFANSGAEAVEGAVKLAKKHAAKQGKAGSHVIALDFSFHGRTALALTLTGQHKYKHGLGTFANYPGVVHVDSPYCYRCPLGLEYPRCGVKCAERLEEAIASRTPGEAAAFIAEPIQGEGGIITPPEEYFRKVAEICRKHGVLFICDEVQTGFGRTGGLFAAEHYGLLPDIMTMAKALGGGLPIGAIGVSEEVASSIEAGDHFSTFGGNLVSCAAALAAVEATLEERLHENAEMMGRMLKKGLEDIQREVELVGEVRGKGLMIGVELVRDRESKEPADREASRVAELLLRSGIVIGVGGVYKNVLRLQPPLVVDENDVNRVLEALSDALRQASEAGRP